MARKRIKDLDLASSTTGSEFVAIDYTGYASAKKIALSSIGGGGSATMYVGWGFTDESVSPPQTNFLSTNAYTNLNVGSSIAASANSGDFTVSNAGVITYTGATTKLFHVTVNASLDGQNGDEIRVAITKNLTPVVGALSGDIMSNNKSVGVFVSVVVGSPSSSPPPPPVLDSVTSVCGPASFFVQVNVNSCEIFSPTSRTPVAVPVNAIVGGIYVGA